MKLNRYEFKSGDKFLTYEFLSEGPKGKIQKLIQFSLVNQDSSFFNLAFGDKNLETGEIDDLVITDNVDSEKVLATVVSAVYAFCDKFPKAWIYATGSIEARTRLYKMGYKYFDIVLEDFEIFIFTENEWQPFVNGKNYQAFVL